MSEEESKKRLLSAYKGLHKAFLVNHHPGAYVAMEQKGTLEAHLTQRGEEAAARYLALKAQMQETAKTIANPREQEAYLNSIPFAVDEIVLQELVYAWP
jgi:hypothetical protein